MNALHINKDLNDEGGLDISAGNGEKCTYGVLFTPKAQMMISLLCLLCLNESLAYSLGTNDNALLLRLTIFCNNCLKSYS